MNLYELTAEYQHLQNVLETGEDDDFGYVEELLASTEKDIEKKADGYARVIKNLEADEEKLKAEEKRIKEKRQVLNNSIKRLKDNLYNAMLALGKKEIPNDIFKIKIQKNGGVLPVILDVPIEELDDQFVIVTEEPNNTAIRKYIEETGDITNFHLGERGESLRIK